MGVKKTLRRAGASVRCDEKVPDKGGDRCSSKATDKGGIISAENIKIVSYKGRMVKKEYVPDKSVMIICEKSAM